MIKIKQGFASIIAEKTAREGFLGEFSSIFELKFQMALALLNRITSNPLSHNCDNSNFVAN
jgi:hypothetical protein